MYNDMIYRNDELKRDLEQADRKAAQGWRLYEMHSRQPSLLATAGAILSSILIEVGQWLALLSRSSLANPA